MRTVLLLVAVCALAACAEREQTASGIKSDAAPYRGTDGPFMTQGWTPGDRNSWEQHLKVRTVQAQNEYVRIR